MAGGGTRRGAYQQEVLVVGAAGDAWGAMQGLLLPRLRHVLVLAMLLLLLLLLLPWVLLRSHARGTRTGALCGGGMKEARGNHADRYGSDLPPRGRGLGSRQGRGQGGKRWRNASLY